jgi:rfaE bifunctional protein kinase chain/domain
MLGGAANVALNIKSMGAEAILCSVTGNDKYGEELIRLMKEEGLTTEGILQSDDRITTTKYRVIGNRMQMLRVDEEVDHDLNEKDTAGFINSVSKLLDSLHPDVIILQDYNKGVLSAGVIEKVKEMASAAKIPVAVDPKKKNFTLYSEVTLFKPNLKEITEGLKTDIDPKSIESLQKAARLLHSNQDIELVMITLSEHGVFISARSGSEISIKIIPAVIRSIADVSGAGDSVISIAALCLALKTQPELLAALSNIAGGQVCEYSGVVPVQKDKLLVEALAELTK